MTPKVSVVIPSLGRYDRLVRCVRSVLQPGSVHLEEVIVVIDGPNSEETSTRLRRELSDTALLKIDASPVRRGSPHAKNVGAGLAGGEVVAFLDDDTEVLSGWLDALVEGYREGIVGVGGSELKNSSPDFARRAWFFLHGNATGKVTRSGQVISNFTESKPSPEEVDCLAGCNMSFLRKEFEDCGGFDKRYEGTAYREETDLCLSLKGRLLFVPGARVLHHEDQSGGNTPSSVRDWNYWYHRNNTYFFLKNLHSKGWAGRVLHGLSEVVLSFGRVLSQKSMAPLSVMPKGVRDGRALWESSRRSD